MKERRGKGDFSQTASVGTSLADKLRAKGLVPPAPPAPPAPKVVATSPAKKRVFFGDLIASLVYATTGATTGATKRTILLLVPVIKSSELSHAALNLEPSQNPFTYAIVPLNANVADIRISPTTPTRYDSPVASKNCSVLEPAAPTITTSGSRVGFATSLTTA